MEDGGSRMDSWEAKWAGARLRAFSAFSAVFPQTGAERPGGRRDACPTLSPLRPFVPSLFNTWESIEMNSQGAKKPRGPPK